jgi:hypothetical protein
MAVRTLTDDGIPLDVSALEKGDFIPPELCEKRTKCRDRNHPKYALELLAFRDRIDVDLFKLGRNWTLSCHGHGIKVLTDEEASVENEKAFKAGQRLLGRRMRKNMGVDISRLSEQRAPMHEHELLCQQRIVAAQRKARREVKLLPHQRSTPGLPGQTPTNTR